MKTITVADLGQMYDGPHATPTRRDEGPYFLNIASLNGGRLDLSQSDHVSDEDFEKWTRRVTPQGGDLLFSYETRLGDTALMPDGVDACLGRRMALIRPDRDVVDPRYLLYRYLAPDFQRRINERAIHGATVSRIGLATMGAWPVDVHELAQQRAIAEVLGALDDKIAANDRLVSVAERLMVARMSTALNDVTVSELADHERRSLSPSLMGDTLVSHYSLPAFDENRLPVAEAASRILSGKFEVAAPCVLMSKLNPRFPRVWDLPSVSPDALASTEFVVLIPRTVSTSALWAALSQPRLGQELEDRAAGTSGSHQRVRPQEILNARIPDPRSLREDDLDLIADLGRRVFQARGESQKLAALRDALLPELMSGRLTVKDAESQVEEVV